MKPQQLYEELKTLAHKLGIAVMEVNLRTVGLPVQSGLCRVHNELRFIMDKHQSLPQKIEILADCLDAQPHEELYVVPALREFFIRRRGAGESIPATRTPPPGAKSTQN
jgi:hypothetical protein